MNVSTRAAFLQRDPDQHPVGTKRAHENQHNINALEVQICICNPGQLFL